MIFPIGDDQVKGGYRPIFSYSFIALNVIIYLFESQMEAPVLSAFVENYGAVPFEITQGQNLFTVFTSMFLHGGFMHLLGNMLFLWVFADNIEAAIGNFQFLIFYLLGGLAAAAGHIFFNWNSPTPMVGASGAISAVMGAYLVMFPASRIRMLFIIFTFRISAWVFLGVWIFQQYSYGASALMDEVGQGGGVAWWAHVGGFAFGVAAGIFIRFSGLMRGVELHVQA